MTTKIGVQDYKGIKIDYSREELLGDFAIATLKDRYFWQNEDHAQDQPAGQHHLDQRDRAEGALDHVAGGVGHDEDGGRGLHHSDADQRRTTQPAVAGAVMAQGSQSPRSGTAATCAAAGAKRPARAASNRVRAAKRRMSASIGPLSSVVVLSRA